MTVWSCDASGCDARGDWRETGWVELTLNIATTKQFESLVAHACGAAHVPEALINVIKQAKAK